MQVQTRAMTVKKLSAEEMKAVMERLEALQEFRESKAVELGRQSEMMLSLQDHMCNIGIK